MKAQVPKQPKKLKLKKIAMPAFHLQGGICISPGGTGPTFPDNPRPSPLAMEPICF